METGAGDCPNGYIERRVYSLKMTVALLWSCLENEELIANCSRHRCGKVQQVLILLGRGDWVPGNANKMNNLQ